MQVSSDRVFAVYLTGDFPSIISWRRLWEQTDLGVYHKPQLTLPRQKSCMVLTRSMATINNIPEDKPQLTALEKQVQVLTAAVERLTKQNQVLEE